MPNSQVKEVYKTKFHRYMNSDDIHFMRGSYTIKPQIYLLIITHSMIRRFDAFSNRISFATSRSRCSCYVCVLRGIITDYSIRNTLNERFRFLGIPFFTLRHLTPLLWRDGLLSSILEKAIQTGKNLYTVFCSLSLCKEMCF